MARGEHGAALATVLLCMVLVFILIMSMLAVAANEIVIAGLQRDSVRALELAQGGLEEAIARVEAGRPYMMPGGFESSLDPRVTVRVARLMLGTSSAYLELRSTANNIGRARRTLGSLVLQHTMFPPNATLGGSITASGHTAVTSGDVYARFYQHYRAETPAGTTLVYAGWRVSRCANPDAPCTDVDDVPPCYTNVQCAEYGRPNWYPGQRRAVLETTAVGARIKALTRQCPAGDGGVLPAETITGVLASDATGTSVTVALYGHDLDAGLAVSAGLPCGLPYMWVRDTFIEEDGAGVVERLFKTVVFEQWFNRYWQFDTATMSYVRTPALAANPQYGAVPPQPGWISLEGNYDRKVTGGGEVGIDLGCHADMTAYPPCMPPTSEPKTVWLDGGTFRLPTGRLMGHGTMYVNGALAVSGDFEYWGMVVVNGLLSTTGTVVVHGGLMARDGVRFAGRTTVDGGGAVSSIPIGRSVVTPTAWWER